MEGVRVGSRARALDIGSRRGRAGVLEVTQRAVARAEHQVEVAIVVQVGKRRRAVGAGIDAMEGIRVGALAGALDIELCGNGAGVLEVAQRAIAGAEHQIEVAIIVQIHKRRCAPGPGIDRGQGVGGAGQLDIDRRCGRAGVPVVAQRAVDCTGHQIKIAVAIQINKDRSRDSEIEADRAGSQYRVVVADRRIVVPRPLRIQHEYAIAGIGVVGFGKVEIDIHQVIAQARVQGGDGPQVGALMRAVDQDRIVAEAGPEGDAGGEAAIRDAACHAGIGPEGDRGLCQVDPAEGVVTAGEAAHRDFGAGRLGPQRNIGDHDVLVVQRARLAADHQLVPAGAGVDVQRAIDVVQMAGQEVGRGIEADVRGGGNEDAVVAGTCVDAGRRRRALDIEHVGAAAERDVQVFDFVVIDAFHPCRDDGGAGFDVIRARCAIDRKGGGKDVAGDVLDAEHIALAGGAELRPAQEVDLVGELAGDRGQGVARDGAHRGVETGERVDLERQGGGHLFQRRDRDRIHAFAVSHGNGIGAVQHDGPGLAGKRRAAECRTEARRRHREAAQAGGIAGNRHFAGRINQQSGHRHDVDRVPYGRHRHRGSERRTGKRDGPVLPRCRLAGGQDVRRRREQLAIAADDQDHVVFGDRREVRVGAGVDRGGEHPGDVCQGVGNDGLAANHVTATDRYAVEGRGRRAVAQGDRPHLARRRSAGEVQRRFGRRRAVDGRDPDAGHADGQGRPERSAVAIDDDEYTAVIRRRKHIRRVRVDALGERTGYRIDADNRSRRVDVRAGNAAQRDLQGPGLGSGDRRHGGVGEVDRRRTYRARIRRDRAIGPAQRDRRRRCLVLDR